MTGVEILIFILTICWFLAFAGSGVRLVRAGPEEQEEAQRMLTSVIIAGVLITLGPTLITWITGYGREEINGEGRWCSKSQDADDFDPDQDCLPSEFTPVFSRLISGLRAIGAFVLIVGMIWGGIKLRVKTDGRDGRDRPP